MSGKTSSRVTKVQLPLAKEFESVWNQYSRHYFLNMIINCISWGHGKISLRIQVATFQTDFGVTITYQCHILLLMVVWYDW